MTRRRSARLRTRSRADRNRPLTACKWPAACATRAATSRRPGLDRFPGLITKNGIPLDRARETLAQEGYLGHDTAAAVEHTNVADLIDKLQQHPTYSADDEARVDQRAQRSEERAYQQRYGQQRGELQDMLGREEYGAFADHELDDRVLNRATYHYMNGHEPLHAYELAVREALHLDYHARQVADAQYKAPDVQAIDAGTRDGSGEAGAGGGRSGAADAAGRVAAEAPRGGAEPVSSGEGAPPRGEYDPEASARLKAANTATRERAQTFREGPLKGVLQPGPRAGEFKLPDSRVPEHVLRNGPGGYDSVKRYFDAAGKTPDTIAAVQNALLSKLREKAVSDRGGAVSPDGLASFEKANGHSLRALEEASPGFSAKLKDAGSASQTLMDAVRDHTAQMKAERRSAAGKLLGAGSDDEVINRIGKMMTADDGVSQIRDVLGKTASDPQANAGVRNAAGQWLARRFTSDLEEGTSGERAMDGRKFLRTLNRYRAPLAEVMSPQQMVGAERLAKSYDQAQRSKTGSQVGSGSPTTQNAANKFFEPAAAGGHAANGGLLLAAIEGANVGFEHGGIRGAALGLAPAVGGYMIKALRDAGLHDVRAIVNDALMNPDRMRQLLARLPETATRADKEGAGALRRSFLASAAAEEAERRQQAPAGSRERIEPTMAPAARDAIAPSLRRAGGDVDYTTEPVTGRLRSLGAPRQVFRPNDLPAKTDGRETGVVFRQQDGIARIETSLLPDDAQGQGRGTAMYRAFADAKAKEGVAIHSDATLSAPAVAIYEKLKAEGYDVHRAPDAKTISGATFTRGDPVYTIEPGQPNAPASRRADAGDLPHPVHNDRSLDGRFATPETTHEAVRGRLDQARQDVAAMIRAYHGTPHSFDQFDARAGSRFVSRSKYEEGVSFHTLDPEDAKIYGDVVLRSEINPGKTATYDARDLFRSDPAFRQASIDATVDENPSLSKESAGSMYDAAHKQYMESEAYQKNMIRSGLEAMPEEERPKFEDVYKPDPAPATSNARGAIMKMARDAGLDTVHIKGLADVGGDYDQIAVINPKNVRFPDLPFPEALAMARRVQSGSEDTIKEVSKSEARRSVTDIFGGKQRVTSRQLERQIADRSHQIADFKATNRDPEYIAHFESHVRDLEQARASFGPDYKPTTNPRVSAPAGMTDATPMRLATFATTWGGMGDAARQAYARLQATGGDYGKAAAQAGSESEAKLLRAWQANGGVAQGSTFREMMARHDISNDASIPEATRAAHMAVGSRLSKIIGDMPVHVAAPEQVARMLGGRNSTLKAGRGAGRLLRRPPGPHRLGR